MKSPCRGIARTARCPRSNAYRVGVVIEKGSQQAFSQFCRNQRKTEATQPHRQRVLPLTDDAIDSRISPDSGRTREAQRFELSQRARNRPASGFVASAIRSVLVSTLAQAA